MKKLFLYIIIFSALPLVTLAQVKYDPLIRIPGVTDTESPTFSGYINFLYALSISLAALLAVIKIIIAGVKYMLSDVVTSKGAAKQDIQAALFGLLLILGAYIILNTINPQLLTGGIKFKTLPDDPEILRPSIKPGSPEATSATQAPNGILAKPDPSIDAFALDGSYYGFDQKSLQTKGNLTGVNADAQCQNYVKSNFTDESGEYQQDEYNDCTYYSKKQLKSYCDDNYGVFSGSLAEKTPPSAVCKVPTNIRKMDTFTKEFEAYKATLPANDFAGRNAKTPTNAVEKDLCEKSGGTWRAIRFKTNVCLKY